MSSVMLGLLDENTPFCTIEMRTTFIRMGSYLRS